LIFGYLVIYTVANINFAKRIGLTSENPLWLQGVDAPISKNTFENVKKETKLDVYI
jgi:hypothetical protein